MSTPTLHDFIDEELLRAPLTLDTVVDAVIERWRERMPAHARQDGDPVRALQQGRLALVSTALAHLRQSAQAELAHAGRPAPGPARTGTAPVSPASDDGLELSLIDEDDVAVDIEIARCTETVKLKAEAELRDLQTYTSALVGDLNVARDTNPFRPEGFVRALWAGVQTLPMSRATQAAFLHQAAEPLASTLRRTYQAAWQRLQEMGVSPASHRTIVVGGLGVAGWGSDTARQRPPSDLHRLRDSLPSALVTAATLLPDGPPVEAAPWRGPTSAAARAQGELPAAPAGGPGITADAQMIELLARLFEAMQTDINLPPDTQALLQRLQPTALRVALRDPGLLDSYEHPLWRFIDRLAHDLQGCAPTQRLRRLGLARNLVDHLSGADLRESLGFEWALERLAAAQRHALAQATLAAAPAIERLQRLAAPDAPPTGTMPLDIGSLDTVPAALVTEPARVQTDSPLPTEHGLPAGTALRAYLGGEWRALESLWQDDQHQLVLLREPVSERLWALHQRAIGRLAGEGLALPMRVRSLARRAADKVLRGV